MDTVPQDLLDMAFAFHGHKCPAMPQGLRAGLYAMALLGVARAQAGELLARVEIGRHHFSGCFADGVMAATGCTVGKGNLEQVGFGKFAVTLVDRQTGRAVRVAARADRMAACLDQEFFRLRRAGTPPQALPPELVDPLIADVLTRPAADLFTVQSFPHYPLPRVAEDFDAVRCADCGELVVRGYATELSSRWYCPPCRDGRLHRPARAE
jgi:formylmethanofuran dehydrogenase subunit E